MLTPEFYLSVVNPNALNNGRKLFIADIEERVAENGGVRIINYPTYFSEPSRDSAIKDVNEYVSSRSVRLVSFKEYENSAEVGPVPMTIEATIEDVPAIVAPARHRGRPALPRDEHGNIIHDGKTTPKKVTSGHRGRPSLPRDENGNIIRNGVVNVYSALNVTVAGKRHRGRPALPRDAYGNIIR
jgi:hypothetical protein